MDTAVFIYIIACYSCGAIGLTVSTVMVLAKPDPIERAHFRFLLAFGLIIASMTIASFMLSREPKDEIGLDYDPKKQILITNGSKQAIAQALLVTVNVGAAPPRRAKASSRMCSMRPARFIVLATVKSQAR